MRLCHTQEPQRSVVCTDRLMMKSVPRLCTRLLIKESTTLMWRHTTVMERQKLFSARYTIILKTEPLVYKGLTNVFLHNYGLDHYRSKMCSRAETCMRSLWVCTVRVNQLNYFAIVLPFIGSQPALLTL